jgi:hypothetical protein
MTPYQVVVASNNLFRTIEANECYYECSSKFSVIDIEISKVINTSKIVKKKAWSLQLI